MKKVKSIAIIAVAVVVLAAAGYFGYTKLFASKLVDSSKYQAVFLSNGQVYFGKLSNLSDQYAEITDIYYMIVKQPLQEQQPADDQTTQNPEYTLIKLGEELHGPADKMILNRDHILFVENLKDDGKVSKAIADYKAGKK